MIDRYVSDISCGPPCCGIIEKVEDGDLVKYEDHQKEIQTLNAQIQMMLSADGVRHELSMDVKPIEIPDDAVQMEYVTPGLTEGLQKEIKKLKQELSEIKSENTALRESHETIRNERNYMQEVDIPYLDEKITQLNQRLESASGLINASEINFNHVSTFMKSKGLKKLCEDSSKWMEEWRKETENEVKSD